MLNRRNFLVAGASSATALLAQAPNQPAAGPAPPAPASPFADPDFGFTALIALGSSYYRQCDPGKLLAILSQIEPGDFESAWKAFHDAGVEAQVLAQDAASKRHTVSAREAYLWAAGYFKAALRAVDGSKDPDRAYP
ncbi:MAG TPA: hypothetical protein VL523_17965, partial [Terriglobia bacterium]|nr:hypothetical protein [Terriglobia bacterium]